MKELLEKKSCIVEVAFTTLICWLEFHVPEETYEVQRMYWLYLTTIATLFFVAYLRNIKLKDYLALSYVIFGMLALILFWKIKGINSAYYGEFYSKVIRLKHVCFLLFSGLVLDLIRHRPHHIKKVIKYPLFWTYVLFSTLGVHFVQSDLIPLIVPMMALVLTDISEDRWSEVMDCFGVGYYIVFVKMFTSSLLFVEDKLYYGRYLGGFANISTTGVHVAIAVVWGIYFYIKWLRSERSKIKLIVLMVLWLYPIVMLFLVNSRSSELGVGASVIVAFAFLHGKNNDVTKKRVVIVSAICILMIPAVVLLAYVLRFLVEKDYISYLPYGLDHIALLANNYETGYFNSELLNRINALSSQRLIDWVELIKQAGIWGTNADLLYTHNVYIFYLIKYGFIGGGLVILWAVTYVVTSIMSSFLKKNVFIMPLLYGSFALFSEIGMNGYWMLPLGFYWLLFSYPLIVYDITSKCNV